MAELVSNPYAGVDWQAHEPHRAQFHTHTSYPGSEGHSGHDAPEVVVDDYHEAGYSVLVLNEHEYNVQETTWPWTGFDRDPDDLDMVGIEGMELGHETGAPHDILSLYSDLSSSQGMTVDDVLDEIGGRGGLAIFAHPGRYNGPDDADWYVDHFERYPHLLGLEVVNAEDRYPTDRDVWDRVQTRLGNSRGVWGFANDDYHGSDAGYTFDRSRNVLFLEELTDVSVRSALERGQFVCQHGKPDDDPPEVAAVTHDENDGELAVEATGADEIQWISEGEIVDRGERLDYRATAVGGYVRARLVTNLGSETCTQPFLFESE